MRRGRRLALLVAIVLALTICPNALAADRGSDNKGESARGASDVSLCAGTGDTESEAESASAGRALLAVGDPERAVLALRRAVARRPSTGAYRIDLARAELARASAAGNPLALLAAADEARSATEELPRSSEAWKVRAQVLERLHLRDAADRARRRSENAASNPRAVSRTSGDEARDPLPTSAEQIDLKYETLERELLPKWSESTLAGESERAEATLRDAELLAEALGRATGDRFPVAAVTHLRIMIAADAGNDEAHALALALKDLDTGYLARRAFQLDGARAKLESARTAFQRMDSPLAQSAALELAICDLYLARPKDARAIAEAGLPLADSRGFVELRGRWHTLLGLLDVFDLRLANALSHYESAVEDLSKTGRAEPEFNARVNLADALGDLGERQDEWRMRFSAHALLPRVRSKTLVSAEFTNAALRAFQAGHLGAALDFADEAVATAATSGVPGDEVEARVWRAQIRIARGAASSALDDIRAAEAKLAGISEPALLKWMRGQIGIAKARALAEHNPRRAVERWTDSLQSFADIGDEVWLAELYLERGRAYVRAGRDDLAELDFEAGIRLFEDSRSDSPEGPSAISYFDRARSLFDEMIEMEALRRNRPEKSFEYAERARARSLRDSLARHRGPGVDGPKSPTQDVLSRIPEDVAILSFASLPGGVVTWIARRDRLEQSFASLSKSILDRATLETAVSGFGMDQENAGCLDGLFDVLIRPSLPRFTGVRRLVIVPDGVLGSLPFAALRNRETGRRLVEDFEIAIAPALSILQRRTSASADENARPVLVVGAPTPDASLFPTLARLPGAALEARVVAALHEHTQELSGTDATKTRFLESIHSARIVHYAGHVITNVERPELSHLLLARDAASGDVGVLLAREIEALDLSACELVVLAGCRSGAGRISTGEGPLSLARSFLVAGSEAVVVALWDIGDIPSAFFFRAFHESVRDGKRPAEALRSAQLACLRSNDASLRDPRVWAAFEIIERSL